MPGLWGRTQRLGLLQVLRCLSWGPWIRAGGKVTAEDTERKRRQEGRAVLLGLWLGEKSNREQREWCQFGEGRTHKFGGADTALAMQEPPPGPRFEMLYQKLSWSELGAKWMAAFILVAAGAALRWLLTDFSHVGGGTEGLFLSLRWSPSYRRQLLYPEDETASVWFPGTCTALKMRPGWKWESELSCSS